jgi:hypothetical protein
MAILNAEVTAKPARQSAGQDARLYGRRDARRYAEADTGLPPNPAETLRISPT